MKKIVLTVIMLGFHIGCFKSNDDLLKIPTDEITRLHVSGAHHFYDSRTHDSNLPKAEVYSSVGYQAKISYPAESVIEFYQLKLKELGFVPYKDSKWTNGKYQWMSFIDGKNKLSRCTYQYLEDWVNKDKTRIAAISIEYHSPFFDQHENCAQNPNNDWVQVTIISEPYEWRIK